MNKVWSRNLLFIQLGTYNYIHAGHIGWEMMCNADKAEEVFFMHFFSPNLSASGFHVRISLSNGHWGPVWSAGHCMSIMVHPPLNAWLSVAKTHRDLHQNIWQYKITKCRSMKTNLVNCMNWQSITWDLARFENGLDCKNNNIIRPKLWRCTLMMYHLRPGCEEKNQGNQDCNNKNIIQLKLDVFWRCITRNQVVIENWGD